MGEHKLERVKSHGWAERQLPPHPQSEILRETGTKLFDKGECQVLVSKEPRPGDGNRLWWHLSISRRDRYPNWEEIKDARYALLPMGLTFAQILPPLNEYTNIHPNCFHLWEVDGPLDLEDQLENALNRAFPSAKAASTSPKESK